MRLWPSLLALMLPGFAMAEVPCVGAGFDTPLPDAVDVTRHNIDVPSARFGGLWQEGRIGETVYQIFSDRTAMIADQLDAPAWRLDIMCDDPVADCRRETKGPVPDDARRLADVIAVCINGAPEAAPAPVPLAVESGASDAVLPEPVTGPEISAGPENAATNAEADRAELEGEATGDPELSADVAPEPESDAVGNAAEPARSGTDSQAVSGGVVAETDVAGEDLAAVVAVPEPEFAGGDLNGAVTSGRLTAGEANPSSVVPMPASCPRPALRDNVAEVRLLQFLLSEAGQNPGPIDGNMGPRTRAALIAVLGASAADLSASAAVYALRETACAE